MALTKKPTGLAIERKDLIFTTKWKIADKDYGNGQQMQYAVFTTQKKYESAVNFLKQGMTITKGVKWNDKFVNPFSRKKE